MPVARLARLHGRLGRARGRHRRGNPALPHRVPRRRRLGFALYDPATETYEPTVLPGGQPFGSAVEAYDTAAIVHLTEYAE